MRLITSDNDISVKLRVCWWTRSHFLCHYPISNLSRLRFCTSGLLTPYSIDYVFLFSATFGQRGLLGLTRKSNLSIEVFRALREQLTKDVRICIYISEKIFFTFSNVAQIVLISSWWRMPWGFFLEISAIFTPSLQKRFTHLLVYGSDAIKNERNSLWFKWFEKKRLRYVGVFDVFTRPRNCQKPLRIFLIQSTFRIVARCLERFIVELCSKLFLFHRELSSTHWTRAWVLLHKTDNLDIFEDSLVPSGFFYPKSPLWMKNSLSVFTFEMTGKTMWLACVFSAVLIRRINDDTIYGFS